MKRNTGYKEKSSDGSKPGESSPLKCDSKSRLLSNIHLYSKLITNYKYDSDNDDLELFLDDEVDDDTDARKAKSDH
ncbi:hypothetical protein BpHYR1_033033 [Brachionus plicatilis]|uniref:Uncharacterized protein n=1 Tax=Brachionus plicatilis TaxID=10195 RepID=A0A3M7QQ52_BRAPC|nr:hypothetical protein BpHYR1_033033 [Brachionus plicatilis]